MSHSDEKIIIKGARVHNLKNIDVELPIDKLTVITGLSGSGKSSLAFDTIYAEGQRRYVESLSSYARQFLGVMSKPDVDSIKGLSPAISIEQKTITHNPRSTVGTITEIYDYLRLLYARIGVPHCPVCGQEIAPQDAQKITKTLLADYANHTVTIMAPLVRGKKGTYEKLFEHLNKQGYINVRVNGVQVKVTDYFGSEKKTLARYNQHYIEAVVDQMQITPANRSRLGRAIEQALKAANGLVLTQLKLQVDSKKAASKEIEKLYSEHLACPDCEVSFAKLEPRMFSFNTPFGACPTCHGLGFIQKFDADLIVPDKDKSLAQGTIVPAGFSPNGIFGQMLEHLAKHFKFSMDTSYKNLPEEIVQILLYGSDHKFNWRFDSNSSDSYWEWQGRWEGILPRLERLYKQTTSESRRAEMEKYMTNKTCHDCQGARLKPESLAVTIADQGIFELTQLSVRNLQEFVDSLELSKAQVLIAKTIRKEILDRLQFLVDVGLDYLTLSRAGGTLSGGEGQRIRLATQIGSELRGVMYVLDEPSIGLHQRDNERLIKTLYSMRDLGNTVIVVEHDEDTILAADYVIDIGPGAGVRGGKVMAVGTPQEIIDNPKSLTGDYLSGRKQIEVPQRRRKPKGWITLEGAAANNLKKINVEFPVEVLSCVTGVSGSGKSTLVSNTLYPALARKLYQAKLPAGEHITVNNYGHADKVIIIDQTPIGRTPRSNPATYTGVFTYIRDLFSQTKEAKIRGYKPGRFSFNVAGGRCGHCEGDGLIKIEMNFLPDVYIECEQCHGQRYNDETLEVTFKDKTIADILDMTVDEAARFFIALPKISGKLQTMIDVGLGYIKLGQSATTLSGGEAQRLKLSVELSKRDTGRTLYILDEPTTGLHADDIKKLLAVLNRLVDKRNTVIVIEHNLDVIKCADWIIDLGPEGGDAGGEVVAVGTPEEIARHPQSYTGKYLKDKLPD
jgi:excinuclease ABC subunit A